MFTLILYMELETMTWTSVMALRCEMAAFAGSCLVLLLDLICFVFFYVLSYDVMNE